MIQAAGREAPSPALQLWEAYHSSSVLAGTLRGAVRAHQECEHLAQLLETVSELLCFVFSRFNDALFLGSLNTHVASAAQLLHFGLLKVCRVADSCCSNCRSTRSNSTAPFSPATTTASAASAAADIQLAVTVLATAVQYLEAAHSVKQSDAAAPQVLPGPRASLQLQQQALLQSSKDTAAAHASARRSTGGARQLSEQLDAVQLFNSAADAFAAGLAGNRYRSRDSTSGAYTQHQQKQSELEDAAQPAVAGELTFNAQWPLEAPADSAASQQQADEQQQEQQEEQSATMPAPPAAAAAAAAAAAERIDPEAYQAAKLQALQELLLPGSTWSLDEGGAGFVCKPSRRSSPQQQQQSPNSSSVKSPKSLAAPQAGQQYDAAEQGSEEQGAGSKAFTPPEEAGAKAVAEDADAADSIAGISPAAAECKEVPDTQLAGALYGEQDAGCNALQPESSAGADKHAGFDDKAKQPQQEDGLQEGDAAVSSTAWLQQQLQQIYSNALLQSRKPQQQRHSLLRRSQELMRGVVDAAELPLLPARAQSPEPAGFGLGFVSAGFISGSGSGGRSVRASTEDLVEAVLDRRARTTAGGTSSSGSMYGSSMAAAAAAGVVSVLYKPVGTTAGFGRAALSPSRGRSSAPGSKRMSVNVAAAGCDSRGRSSSSGGGGGMIGTCSPRGYAGRSYTSRAASVTGCVSQRASSSSSPGTAARAVSGSGHVTPVSPASSTGAAAASANNELIGPGSRPRSGRVTPAKHGRVSSPGATAPAAPDSCGAATTGGSRGGSAAGQGSGGGRRASSSPGQSSVRVTGEWQGLTPAVPPGGAASGRSPSRTGSPSPARQSQPGMQASRDSILSSSRNSIPGDGSSCSGGTGGAGSDAYGEAVAAAASAAGTVYKSANSSSCGSISGVGGLTRRSSAGSTTLFMSARSSRAGSTAGSVAICHQGTGRLRTSSTGGAGTCGVTSAAGVSVLGMLTAAAAGAAEEAATGRAVALNRSVQEGSRQGSSQGDSWLEQPSATVVADAASLQHAGHSSGMSGRTSRAGITSGSCSGMGGPLSLVSDDGMGPGSSPPAAAEAAAAEAGSKDLLLVTGMGCLTLGSCGGGRSGKASLASGGGNAAIAESVRLSRCSVAGSVTSGGSRQLSGDLAVLQQQPQQQQQEAGAGSRSGSSADGCISGRASACSMTGELDVNSTLGAPAAEGKDMHSEQQQQQHQEVLDFLAAAGQDTKQGRMSAAAAASMATTSSAVDALAVAHTLPVSPAQQQQLQQQQRGSVSQQLGGEGQPRGSVSADGTGAADGQSTPAGVDAWQQQQEQWQQQWQQQQQLWQQQVEQQQPAESGAETGAQQQVEEEFSLRPRPVQAGGAAQVAEVEQQQQQVHGDAADRAEAPDSTTLKPCEAPAALCEAEEEAVQEENVHSTTTADSDDFGDFQGSPHADSAAAYFTEGAAAAATCQAGEASEVPAAAAAAVEHADRNSLMLNSTAEPLQLAPGAATEYQPAAAASTTDHEDSATTCLVVPQLAATTPESAAETLLAEGNAAYTAGKYSPAVQCYAKALDSLGGSIAHTTSQAGVLLWTKCSLNLACCHLRLGEFQQCVALCDGLLEVGPANIVALCHRGRALLMVQQHAAAKADLTAALELLEEEAAAQMQQQQTCTGQQQPGSTGSQGAVASSVVPGGETAAGTARGKDVVAGPLQAVNGRAAGGAVRPNSRCLSPCTLARMRLNNGYWQQRVVGLLAGIKDSCGECRPVS